MRKLALLAPVFAFLSFAQFASAQQGDIMFGGGTGSEVMRRIAAPMVGGMITAPMLSMLVLPAAYLLIHRRALAKTAT